MFGASIAHFETEAGTNILDITVTNNINNTSGINENFEAATKFANVPVITTPKLVSLSIEDSSAAKNISANILPILFK